MASAGTRRSDSPPRDVRWRSAHATPLAGKTVRESKLRENVSLNLVGMWERGRFILPEPDAVIDDHAVLVLAGTRDQLDDYDELFCIYNASNDPVVIAVSVAITLAFVRQGMFSSTAAAIVSCTAAGPSWPRRARRSPVCLP